MNTMTDTTSNNQETAKTITLIGLGIMGRAVAKAYANQGYQVHAWNRGLTNRTNARNLSLPSIVVYDHLPDALSAGGRLVLIMVLADEMLATADWVISSVPADSWRDKTIVQFTSHEPFAIHHHGQLLQKLHANLIGGAMLAVPTTVGTPQGTFLLSSSQPELVALHLETLQVLGRIVSFQGHDCALADIGLLQGLQFGLAGNELACLIFKRYGVDEDFRQTYIDLIPITTVSIFQSLSQQACRAIFADKYIDQAETYTAAGHLAVYEAHEYFFRRMGLLVLNDEPTYLSVYLERFRQVPNAHCVGPSAIVKTYRFVENDETNDKESENVEFVP